LHIQLDHCKKQNSSTSHRTSSQDKSNTTTSNQTPYNGKSKQAKDFSFQLKNQKNDLKEPD